MNVFKIDASAVPITQSSEKQQFNQDDYLKELYKWIWRAPPNEIPVREQCAEQLTIALTNGEMHLHFSGLNLTEPPPIFPGLALELTSTDAAISGMSADAKIKNIFFWRTAHDSRNL